jgi:hypothetical protein
MIKFEFGLTLGAQKSNPEKYLCRRIYALFGNHPHTGNASPELIT